LKKRKEENEKRGKQDVYLLSSGASARRKAAFKTVDAAEREAPDVGHVEGALRSAFMPANLQPPCRRRKDCA